MPSYIDGFAIYGGTQSRLEWLRTGPDDGNPEEAGPTMMLPGGYLPVAGARGDVATAPKMTEEGALTPEDAVIGGDVRTNENAALDAVTTLFDREHNRIVSELPESLTAEQKFQIARRVVEAEIQYVTYKAFLPAVGVTSPDTRATTPPSTPRSATNSQPSATAPHSMVDGEEEIVVPTGAYSPEQLAGDPGTRHQGRTLEHRQAPWRVAGHQPERGLLQPRRGSGRRARQLLAGLSQTPDYRNDEQIDNALRSVLFETPGSPERTPAQCFEQPQLSGCFSGSSTSARSTSSAGATTGSPATRSCVKPSAWVSPAPSTSSPETKPKNFRQGRNIETPAIMNFTTLTDRKGHSTSPDDPTDRAVAGTGAAAWLRA